ncbi:MAG: sugar ABC transporter permease [Chloroflexota bacterium]|nr:MAG: sugar ABC transporter permease [Chloroflexota bacterium]
MTRSNTLAGRLAQQMPVTERKPNPLWRQIKNNYWSYVFLAPLVVLVGLFVLYPLVASIQITMYDWNGIGVPTRFVGLRHFFKVATDPLFWNAFKNTFTYALVLVPVQLTLALILALILNNPKLKGSTIYRAIYFSPVVTSAAMIGVVLSILLGSFGMDLSMALVNAGLIKEPIDWLGSPQFALWVVIGVGIWHTLGYNLVYFLAALQSIPKELYEAAWVDGANAYHQFTKITVPMLREVGLVIVFLAILGSLQIFDLVLVMTGGGPYFASEVVSTYIYHYAFTPAAVAAESNVGYASAAALFMGLLVMGLTAMQLISVRYARRRRTEYK